MTTLMNYDLGTLLIDLSKKFDCLSLEYLLVKVHTYDFIFLHQDWFTNITNRKQKTKINSVYRSPYIKGDTLDDVIKKHFDYFKNDYFSSSKRIEQMGQGIQEWTK